jgi:hypothetical protein
LDTYPTISNNLFKMKKITRTSHCTCCTFWSGRPLGLHTPHIGEDYNTHPSLLSCYGTHVAGNTCSLALVDVALHQHRSVGRSGPHRQQRQVHMHHMKLNVPPPQVSPSHVPPLHDRSQNSNLSGTCFFLQVIATI